MGPTIVYLNSQKQTDGMAAYLQGRLDSRVEVLRYHAGMAQTDRDRAQQLFADGVSPIICATVAFGMGIDKADLRRVVHFGAPRTLEAYYQQVGRAGRDGLPARCTMIFSSQEFVQFLTSDFYHPLGRDGSVNERHLQALNASTEALRSFCESSAQCRQVTLVQYLRHGATGERFLERMDREVSDGEYLRFPPWCGCDVCREQRRLLDSAEQGDAPDVEDFATEARCILEVLATFGPRRSRGVVLNLLLGRNFNKMQTNNLLNTNIPAHEQVFGCWRRETEHAANKRVVEEFMDLLHKQGLLTREVKQIEDSFGFDTFGLTPAGRRVLGKLRKGIVVEEVFFVAGEVLRAERDAALSKRRLAHEKRVAAARAERQRAKQGKQFSAQWGSERSWRGTWRGRSPNKWGDQRRWIVSDSRRFLPTCLCGTAERTSSQASRQEPVTVVQGLRRGPQDMARAMLRKLLTKLPR